MVSLRIVLVMTNGHGSRVVVICECLQVLGQSHPHQKVNFFEVEPATENPNVVATLTLQSSPVLATPHSYSKFQTVSGFSFISFLHYTTKSTEKKKKTPICLSPNCPYCTHFFFLNLSLPFSTDLKKKEKKKKAYI